MKLWVVERDAKLVGYGEYLGWLIAHETAEEAIEISGYALERGITVRCVGEALPDAAAGTILMDSFNAG